MNKWIVSDDSVGIRSCLRLLEVVSAGESTFYFPVASTEYTGNFTKTQLRVAQRLADALNAAEVMWHADKGNASE